MKMIREILSGANNRLSSKRITGAFCVISATCVILYLAITDSSFPSINGLLECVLFTGGGLLGLGLAERKFTSSADDADETKTASSTRKKKKQEDEADEIEEEGAASIVDR